jgi:hypothetical protein
MYVLHMKEVEDENDATKKELETIRDRFHKELNMTKTRLSKELADARKALESEIDQKTQLQGVEQGQHAELVKLRARIKECGDIATVLHQAHVELAREKEGAKAYKEALATHTIQLSSARRRMKELESENRKITTR